MLHLQIYIIFIKIIIHLVLILFFTSYVIMINLLFNQYIAY